MSKKIYIVMAGPYYEEEPVDARTDEAEANHIAMTMGSAACVREIELDDPSCKSLNFPRGRYLFSVRVKESNMNVEECFGLNMTIEHGDLKHPDDIEKYTPEERPMTRHPNARRPRRTFWQGKVWASDCDDAEQKAIAQVRASLGAAQ